MYRICMHHITFQLVIFNLKINGITVSYCCNIGTFFIFKLFKLYFLLVLLHLAFFPFFFCLLSLNVAQVSHVVQLFLLWLFLLQKQSPFFLELVVKFRFLTPHLDQLLEMKFFIIVQFYVKLLH